MAHSHADHKSHDHGAMVEDFRKRVWVFLILTIPVLALSPMIQHALGLKGAIALADIIRSETKEVIVKLQSMGTRCIMMTGDSVNDTPALAQADVGIGLGPALGAVLTSLSTVICAVNAKMPRLK